MWWSRKKRPFNGVGPAFGVHLPLRPLAHLDFVSPGTPRVSVDWLGAFRPGDPAQTMGCCVGRGSANVAETLLLAHNPGALGNGEQIDGERLYLWIREHDYGDQDPEGGASLEQGARALIAAGILPPDSVAERVELHSEALVAALLEGPLIQGHMIDAAWDSPNGGRINRRHLKSMGGHCTVCLGVWWRRDGGLDVLGGNSWGDAWGRGGTFVMDYSIWSSEAVDCWRLRVNADSMKNWSSHRAWLRTGG